MSITENWVDLLLTVDLGDVAIKAMIEEKGDEPQPPDRRRPAPALLLYDELGGCR